MLDLDLAELDKAVSEISAEISAEIDASKFLQESNLNKKSPKKANPSNKKADKKKDVRPHKSSDHASKEDKKPLARAKYTLKKSVKNNPELADYAAERSHKPFTPTAKEHRFAIETLRPFRGKFMDMVQPQIDSTLDKTVENNKAESNSNSRKLSQPKPKAPIMRPALSYKAKPAPVTKPASRPVNKKPLSKLELIAQANTRTTNQLMKAVAYESSRAERMAVSQAFNQPKSFNRQQLIDTFVNLPPTPAIHLDDNPNINNLSDYDQPPLKQPRPTPLQPQPEIAKADPVNYNPPSPRTNLPVSQVGNLAESNARPNVGPKNLAAEPKFNLPEVNQVNKINQTNQVTLAAAPALKRPVPPKQIDTKTTKEFKVSKSRVILKWIFFFIAVFSLGGAITILALVNQ